MKLDYAMLGERIREQRKQKKWTQEKLGEQIEKSTAFVGHIERGTRRMSVDTFYRLAKALDCSADVLLELESHTTNRLADARELLSLANRLAMKERNL